MLHTLIKPQMNKDELIPTYRLALYPWGGCWFFHDSAG